MAPTIVAGFNGSAESKDGLTLAERLADLLDAELIVGCAYSHHPLLGESAHQQSLRHEAETAAEEARELLSGRAHAGARVVPGHSPAHALHDLAEQKQAQIMVLGSTHRAPVGDILVGGTGQQLLRGTPCAVAVAPRGYRLEADEPFESIGAAFDGSPESADAVFTAATLARAAHLPLEIERVVWFPQPGEERMIPAWEADIEALAANAEDEMNAVIEAVGNGVAVSGRTVRGGATSELVRWSSELDLLVVGSRSYGPARQVLLGSTSGELMRRANCPVIVVPRGVERLLDAFARHASHAGSPVQ